jgi:hypothetical protein
MSALQNLFVNLTYGGAPEFSGMLTLGVILFVWINFILVLSFMGKIAGLLVVKGYIEKKMVNPLKLFISNGWHYFWRYIWLGIRAAWYALWPLLLFVVVIALLSMKWMPQLFIEADFGPAALVILLGGLALLGLTIYRSTKAFAAQMMLIHFDKTSIPTFKKSLQLVNGNWWRVFGSFFIFVLLVQLVRVFFVVPDQILAVTPDEPTIFALLDFIFSFFVLTPLLLSFPYFLMLHLSKVKRVKP